MHKIFIVLLSVLVFSCAKDLENEKLVKEIGSNEGFSFVKNKAIEVVKTGFNAGDGYGEVWINTKV